MKAPEGWCEPSSPESFPTISSPVNIPSTDAVDESNVSPFLRDDIDFVDTTDDREWQGNFYILFIPYKKEEMLKLYTTN